MVRPRSGEYSGEYNNSRSANIISGALPLVSLYSCRLIAIQSFVKKMA